MLRIRTLFLVLCCAAAAAFAQADLRTWTSAKGAQITARFVALQGDTVVLQREDGKRLGITLAAQFLRVALSFGQQHGAVAVGFGADFVGLFFAFGAQPSRSRTWTMVLRLGTRLRGGPCSR